MIRLVPPALAAVLLLAAGCAPPSNREQLTQEVLKADPAFAQVLDQHRELANRIQTFNQELALKRKTVDESIAQLRRDLVSATATVRVKTDELKKKIEPDRQRLQLSLSLAGEELRAKQVQRASLGRSVARIKKSLTSQSAPLAPRERERQQAQLEELLKDASRLDHELAGLNAHVRLLKIKLLLIKL